MITELSKLHPTILHISHFLAACLIALIAYHNGALALEWWMLIAAIIVGNLPNIDTPSSKIGSLAPGLSSWIESTYGRSTVTHSIWPIIAIALMSWISNIFVPWWLFPAFYASHIILDMIIGGEGVPLLWPNPARFYLGRRIENNSLPEKIIAGSLLVIVIALFIIAVPLIIGNPL